MIDIEVCANSIQSAVAAKEGGAKRVELCTNLGDGGTTPAKSVIELIRDLIDIELNILVRPRGGDFFYDKFDLETMKKDIILCSQLNCNGVVFGILNVEASVDTKENKYLVDLAKDLGLSTTFHRAFDHSNDLNKAIEIIIDLGFDRLLTSGGCISAYEGRDVLSNLVSLYGNDIKIMAGAGIGVNNALEIVKATGVSEIHGTFQKNVVSNMKYLNPKFHGDNASNYKISDKNIIQDIYHLVNDNM